MFERLSHWFSGPKSPVNAVSKPAITWAGEELELLLWAERQQVLGQMELPGRSGLFHSALLALDLVENQLLIDLPFPSPPIELLLPGAACKLAVGRHQQMIQLTVHVKEQLVFQGKTALLVQIEGKHFHCDRRLSARITFERSLAPIMRIQVPMVEQLRASVLNLSSGGALLNVFGKHEGLKNFTSPFNAKLQLEEGTCLDVRCELKSVSYYRRPCQHMQLRVQFVAMSAQDTRKLGLFIASHQEKLIAICQPSVGAFA